MLESFMLQVDLLLAAAFLGVTSLVMLSMLPQMVAWFKPSS
jgi:hypothetical protein